LLTELNVAELNVADLNIADLNIGVVGIPGKWSTDTLADAVETRTGRRIVVDMGRVELDLAAGRLLHGDIDLCTLDGLIVKKISATYSPATLDRLEMLRVAEACGVRVFSPANNMLRLVDRLSCTVTLRNAGIPMPETRITEDIDLAVGAVTDFGNAVFKPLYSTKARGMCVISSTAEEQDIRDRVSAFRAENTVMYIQRRIDLPGRDLGMVFLAGDYLGCYARVPQDDAWNTTIESGGRYAAHQPTTQEIELAHKAQALFGMDFTTVDVAETPNGPIVFEVSAFGGFRGAREGIGIDVAELYVDYVVRNLEKRP
jgi:ribosomal protein S6--L-glutamate ligase